MNNSSVQNIKKAQKERQLFRELSHLFLRLILEDNRLRDFHISRVRLSPDKGICTIYFYSARGQDYFNEILEILKLYRPSLRKAISAKIESRYTPELRFAFDEHYEKQEKLEKLMDAVKNEEEPS